MTTDDGIRSLLKTVSASLKAKDLKIGTLGDGADINEVPYWISTGCLPLDIVLTGGVPGNRMIEVFGENSSGKSLFGAMFSAQVQQMGGIAVYADPEGTVSKEFFQNQGVDVDNLAYFIPKTLDDVYKFLVRLAIVKNKMYGPDVPIGFVWDSVAATGTLNEKNTKDVEAKEGVEGKSYPDHARIISQSLRRFSTLFQEAQITSVYINQSKNKMGAQPWDFDTINTFGGSAIKFYASERIELSSVSKIRHKDNKKIVLGVTMRATNRKNKVGPAFRTVDIPTYFGWGMHEAGAMMNMLKQLNLYENSGAYYNVTLLDGSSVRFKRSEAKEVLNQYRVELYGLLEHAYLIPDPDAVQGEAEEGSDDENS